MRVFIAEEGNVRCLDEKRDVFRFWVENFVDYQSVAFVNLSG